MDERFSIHNVTVQGLPATQPRPKKRLNHTVKAIPSAPIDGAYAPIPQRAPLRRKRGLLGRLLK